VALSDEDLLDFGLMELGGLEVAPRKLLREHGDVYRSHLLIARAFVNAADLTRARTELGTELDNSVIELLLELAARLRQGDLLPGGVWYESEQAR
jgi:hypothetical protein